MKLKLLFAALACIAAMLTAPIQSTAQCYEFCDSTVAEWVPVTALIQTSTGCYVSVNAKYRKCDTASSYPCMFYFDGITSICCPDSLTDLDIDDLVREVAERIAAQYAPLVFNCNTTASVIVYMPVCWQDTGVMSGIACMDSPCCRLVHSPSSLPPVNTWTSPSPLPDCPRDYPGCVNICN